MNAVQVKLLAEIERIKALLRTDGPFKFKSGKPASREQLQAQLPGLAHALTSYDYREYRQRDDPGGRSRSPSFGKWGAT